MEPVSLTLFLSPHFDDIALSCGGIAARLSRMGAHGVGIALFAAPHQAGVPLSEFAEGMHEQWQRAAGMDVQSINAVRRREEEAAMRLLGLERVWLDLRDGPYRRGQDGRYLYTSDQELFDLPATWERSHVIAEVVARVREVASREQERIGSRGRVRVFAPLGVGRHVDHQLVYLAARRLGPRFGVLYYEDYPYAAREGALLSRLRELDLTAQPRVTQISDLIGVKIAAIARYKSQLEMLFGSAEAMPEAVRAYTGSVAAEAGLPPGEYAERVWQLPPVYSLR